MHSLGSENKISVSLLFVCVIASALIGAFIGAGVINFLPKDNNALLKEFYDVETAAKVSPSDYVGGIDGNNSVGLLVDLRSREEYAAAHMIGSVNVPAPQMNEEQLIVAFSSLPKDKPIITFCYSSYCMLSATVGKVLADKGIYVKHFSVGWLEIVRDYNSYVVTTNGTVFDGSGNNLVCSTDPNATFKC